MWAASGAIDCVTPNRLPAKIISMSFTGLGACLSYLQSAVQLAVNLGVVLVAAAGNSATDSTLYFPGNGAGVVSAGATTIDGALAQYSN